MHVFHCLHDLVLKLPCRSVVHTEIRLRASEESCLGLADEGQKARNQVSEVTLLPPRWYGREGGL